MSYIYLYVGSGKGNDGGPRQFDSRALYEICQQLSFSEQIHQCPDRNTRKHDEIFKWILENVL